MWICPKCRLQKQPTKHHIFPRRHFGRRTNNHILKLCRECHADLEKMIPFYKMHRDFYKHIIEKFFKGEKNESRMDSRMLNPD